MNTKELTESNIQSEVEGILKKHLYCVMRGSYFADNSANKTTYKGVAASPFMTSEGIEALTSLIEQESERAVEKFADWLYRDEMVTSGLTTSKRLFIQWVEQYLAESKEE